MVWGRCQIPLYFSFSSWLFQHHFPPLDCPAPWLKISWSYKSVSISGNSIRLVDLFVCPYASTTISKFLLLSSYSWNPVVKLLQHFFFFTRLFRSSGLLHFHIHLESACLFLPEIPNSSGNLYYIETTVSSLWVECHL